MPLGAHMSVAGGIDRAPERGREAGCEAIQIFTRNSNRWGARPVEGEEAGLERVRVIHLNDAKRGLGSRVDRHEHISRGCVGVEAFRCLLRDRRFAGVPKLLETPKGKDGTAADRRNLAVLRRLGACPSNDPGQYSDRLPGRGGNGT